MPRLPFISLSTLALVPLSQLISRLILLSLVSMSVDGSVAYEDLSVKSNLIKLQSSKFHHGFGSRTTVEEFLQTVSPTLKALATRMHLSQLVLEQIGNGTLLPQFGQVCYGVRRDKAMHEYGEEPMGKHGRQHTYASTGYAGDYFHEQAAAIVEDLSKEYTDPEEGRTLVASASLKYPSRDLSE